jgi:mannose-1-phosphate guanylyltransferase
LSGVEGGASVVKQSNVDLSKMNQAVFSENTEDGLICGIVLAGGEGKRLQPFIKSLGKGTLPKQYVNLIGTHSMLEHTLRRAEKLIPSERVLTVITEAHLRYPEVKEQCSNRPKDTVIIQPENKETGPGVFFPLIHLYKRYPNSLVLALPSDHFIWEEERLMDYARMACLVVKRDPSRLVLLGIKPDQNDTDYGYILPSPKPMNIGPNLSEISWFIEKPERRIARRLVQAGALWNTMIMAFKTKTILHWLSRLAPRFYGQLQKIYEVIGTARETEVVREIYRRLEPMNFSKEFLEPLVKSYPSSLVALPIPDVCWSDWGTATRIKEVLTRIDTIQRLNGSQRLAGRKIADGNQCLRQFHIQASQPISSQMSNLLPGKAFQTLNGRAKSIAHRTN